MVLKQRFCFPNLITEAIRLSPRVAQNHDCIDLVRFAVTSTHAGRHADAQTIPKTQIGYIRSVWQFAAYLKRSLDTETVEVPRLLAAVSHLKHQTVSYVAYGVGLRVSEVCALKVSDIDSEHMALRIEQGKGGIDSFQLIAMDC